MGAWNLRPPSPTRATADIQLIAHVALPHGAAKHNRPRLDSQHASLLLHHPQQLLLGRARRQPVHQQRPRLLTLILPVLRIPLPRLMNPSTDTLLCASHKRKRSPMPLQGEPGHVQGTLVERTQGPHQGIGDGVTRGEFFFYRKKILEVEAP